MNAELPTIDLYVLQIKINLPGKDPKEYACTSSKIDHKSIDGGHVFVTLTHVSFPSTEIESSSFGLYPAEKTGIIKGEDIKGEIRDDTNSYYDNSFNFFISEENYLKALDYALKTKSNPPSYNLYTNNCTDFGVKVASKAGIKIPNSSVGSNPTNLNKILNIYKMLGKVK